MEKVKISLSSFFSHPKDAFLQLCKDVFGFYKNSIGSWIGNKINNIIQEKIKGTKVEIQLKQGE